MNTVIVSKKRVYNMPFMISFGIMFMYYPCVALIKHNILY